WSPSPLVRGRWGLSVASLFYFSVAWLVVRHFLLCNLRNLRIYSFITASAPALTTLKCYRAPEAQLVQRSRARRSHSRPFSSCDSLKARRGLYKFLVYVASARSATKENLAQRKFVCPSHPELPTPVPYTQRVLWPDRRPTQFAKASTRSAERSRRALVADSAARSHPS